MEYSKIEWTDHTFNPWIGCQKVSLGCDRCYAETMMDHRFGKVEWGPRGERKRTSIQNWKQPYKWDKQCAETGTGTRAKVFCASLADVWDNKANPEWRAELFTLIAETPNLDWLLLTKRPENIDKMLSAVTRGIRAWPWPNVWLGITAEDQANYDRRWRKLQKVSAAVRFVSYEPAIGPLKLGNGIVPDWVICGGETGAGARTMKKRWAREVRDECADLNVAFFMKQMTNKATIPDQLLVRQFPKSR